MNKNMKIIIKIILAATLLAAVVLPAAAQNQADPSAFLVYFDDDFELEVFDGSGDYIGEVYIGMELSPGSTIKTYNTTAEIQLDPNGSILKISDNSVFQIEAFQKTPDESNDFSLFNGKLRVIAARAGLGYENYSIVTQSAVCGVRGTDFVIDSIGVVAVKEGAVEFSSLLNGETIDVAAGQLADVFADSFAPMAATAQSLSSIFGGMEFKGTDPAQVPGHTVTPDEPAEEPADEPEDDEAVEEEGEGDETEADAAEGDTGDTEAADESASESPQPAEEAETTASGPPTPAQQGSAAASITGSRRIGTVSDDADEEDEETVESEPGPLDDFFDGLFDLLAFEIGSINIDGTTYAKAVVQPEFEIGDLKVGLYLPVIYTDNLFEPSSWYKPAGNNEWSFGTDQSGAFDIVFDVFSDLFLKIKYVQWGDNRDDFYFKFGNLDNMTIGHGILMYDFANNYEFPAIRKVGINTGINFENVGLEAVVDDASDPTIFGGRFVYMPFGSSFPLGLGISAVTDINPDSETETVEVLWDPLILNGAIDIGYPINLINMTIFAEAAALVPYIDSSWHFETFYDSTKPDFLSALNNYGVSAGIYGELFTLDYRLEYRFSKGIFKPAFYNTSYLSQKTEYFNELETYLADPSLAEYQEITMGIYGELSANFFDAVTLEGGYLWPWTVGGGSLDFSADDYFYISAAIMPDIIPVVGLHGSVTYSRVGLAGSIADAVENAANFQILNADSILTGELVYPVDSSLDIAIQFATALSRNEDGQIDYTDGVPEIYYAMTVDTRIHF